LNDIVRASGFHMLLAEDDPSNRKVTQLMLRRLGYETDAATNGLEVLQALEERTYDLVLMDIVMPKMDGLVAAEEIRRRWPAPRQPRIIAYTAYILPDNGYKNLLKNMDGYLFKPVKKEDLRTAIEANLRILDRRRSSSRRWDLGLDGYASIQKILEERPCTCSSPLSAARL
jgi:CheY-like chemotaxis protein